MSSDTIKASRFPVSSSQFLLMFWKVEVLRQTQVRTSGLNSKLLSMQLETTGQRERQDITHLSSLSADTRKIQVTFDSQMRKLGHA